MSYALVRVTQLDLETFARTTRTHPDLIRRLVALGILDATRGTDGEPWLSPDQIGVLARVQRLRAGLAINYAAVGMITDLLERITVLQKAVRRSQQPGG
jgi:chaperone modulatory protein CbpM